jgi:hypothetical protein
MKRWAWVLGVVLAGCDDSEVPAMTASPAAVVPKARAATVALYGDPAVTTLTPFPSNRYTSTDSSSPTGLRVKIDARPAQDAVLGAFPQLAAQLSGADGFSTVGGVAVSFQGDLEPTQLARGVDGYTTPDAPLVMLDVDAASPERGQATPLVVSYYPTRSTDDGPRVDYTLVAQPARPLRPRTSYLFVVTSRLRDLKGLPVGPSEATDALLAGGEGAYGARVRAALPLLKKAFDVGADQIALATLFTTASVIDETFAMAGGLRSSSTPELAGALTVVEKGQGGDPRVRFKGAYGSPEFRQTKGDGRFQIKAGAPTPQASVDLEFLLSFSDRNAVGPRPVVIYGHGIGGDKEEVWGTSQRLAGVGDGGVAVIGIDAPEHGARALPGSNPIFSFFAIDDKTGAFDLFRVRDRAVCREVQTANPAV